MAFGDAVYARWSSDLPEGAKRDGGRYRNYVLSCEHATTNLTLERSADDDAQVLSRVIEMHRTASAKAEPAVLCLCVPVGWQQPVSV